MNSKRYLFIFSILFIFSSFFLYGQEVEFDYVLGSQEFRSRFPAELAVDGQEDTYASFNDDAGKGEILLKSKTAFWLDSFTVEGLLPEDVKLSVEYRDAAGNRQVLPGSFLLGLTGTARRDVSKSFAVSDEWYIAINGSGLSSARINEVTFSRLPVYEETGPLELNVRQATDDVSWENNEFFLIDGLAGTLWSPKKSGLYWNRFPEEISHVLKRVYSFTRTRTSWREPTSVTLDVINPSIATELAVYLGKNASGRVKFFAGVGDEEVHLETVDLWNYNEGWLHFPLNLTEPIESLRLELSRYGWHFGGIGEVVLQGAKAVNVDIKNQTLSGHKAGRYKVKSSIINRFDVIDNSPVIELSVPSTIDDSNLVELNGFSLEAESSLTSGDIKVIHYPVLTKYLGEDENVVEFADSVLASTLVTGKGCGILKHDNDLLGDGYFATPYAGSSSDRSRALVEDGKVPQTAYVYYSGESPVDIYQVDRFQALQPLSPVEDDGTRQVYLLGENAIGLDFSPPGIAEIRFTGISVPEGPPVIQLLAPEALSVFGDGDDEEGDHPHFWGWSWKSSRSWWDWILRRHIVGVVDSSDYRVWVNGVEAFKKGHIFWIPLDWVSRHQDDGEITVQVEDYFRGSSELNTVVESFNNGNSILPDQPESLIYTEDEFFTVSGYLWSRWRDRLYINGTETTVRRARFNTDIALEPGFNLITLELRGRNGSVESRKYLRIQRLTEAELILIQPGDRDVFPDNLVTVSGFLSSVGGIAEGAESVHINGVAAVISGNRFISFSPVDVLESDGIITIVAVGKSGRIYETTIEVAVDTSPPVVDFVLPAPNTWFINPYAKISGRVQDENPVGVLVNGVPADIVGDFFEVVLDLPDGTTKISIVAKDIAGNSTAYPVFPIRVDTIPPELLAFSPEPGSWHTESQVTLSGQIKDANHTVLTINGNVVSQVDGYFEQVYELSDGSHDFSLVITDEAGNVTVVPTVQLHVDTVAPVIKDVTPVPESWHSSDTVTVAGTVIEENDVIVTVNGVAATQSGEHFEAAITLPDGGNTIAIVAVDKAGNRTEYPEFNIHVDTTPPADFSVGLSDQGWTNNTRPTISFETSDITSGIDFYQVSIGGRAFVTQQSPYMLPYQDDGIHLIKVRAFDKVGNYTDSSTTIYIDTLPPDVAGDFRVVPGNGYVELKWNEDDDETVAYQVGLAGTPQEEMLTVQRGSGQLGTDELAGITIFEEQYQGLSNGSTYQFEIYAIDRAGNVSEPAPAESTVGFVETEIVQDPESETGVLVEYSNVDLLIGHAALEEDIVAVKVTEVENEVLEEQAVYPIISPVYRFTAVDDTDEELNHVQFEKPFVAILEYDESTIPEDFPEDQLDVYYFDTMWSRWFKVDEAAVDTENNRILFSTNHFTDFSVQPTVVEDLSPQQLQDVAFTPFSDTVKHDPVAISPQGGTVSTAMTDLLLPGVNGFDLELRRLYDTGTALGDAAGINVNAAIKIGSLFDIGGTTSFVSSLDQFLSGNGIAQWAGGALLNYFRGMGDYAYSFGQGWRLNLPYVRASNGGVSLRTSDGSYHDISSMKVQHSTNLVAFRNLTLEKHESVDFSFSVIQALVPGLGSASWEMVAAELVEKDGTRYEFDVLGRVTKITDKDGLNEITFNYNAATFVLDYIEDTFGRKIRFEYETVGHLTVVPHISRIYVENDPQIREVNYHYEARVDNTFGTRLPLLSGVTDIGGRSWDYSYHDEFLFNFNTSVKVNFLALIATAVGGPVATEIMSLLGIDTVTVSIGAGFQYAFFMDQASGPGLGYNFVNYKQQYLSTLYAEAADYILGFIPTALQITVNVKPRVTAIQHRISEHADGANGLVTNFSFHFVNASKDQFYSARTVVTNGKVRKEYTYNAVEKVRFRIYDITDVLVNAYNNLVSDALWYSVWIPQNTSIATYSVSTGELLERSDYTYDNATLRRIKDVTTKGEHSQIQTMQYDNWGNVGILTTTVSGPGYQRSMTRYSDYYNASGVSLGGVQWPQSPLGTTNIDQVYGVHDRLLRSATVYSIDDPEQPDEYKTDYKYFQYSGRGQLVAQAALQNENTWSVNRYAYNETGAAKGEISRMTDPEGQVTDYSYNYGGNSSFYTKTNTLRDVQLGQNDVRDVVSSMGYYRYSGLPAWSKDGRGYVSSFVYDKLGRTVLQVKPDDNDDIGWNPLSNFSPSFRSDNPETQVSYNDSTLTVTLTDPLERKSEYDFDQRGRLVRRDKYTLFAEDGTALSNARIVRRTLAYDAFGNVLEVTDPHGNPTKYTYDDSNRLASVTHPVEDGVQYSQTHNYDNWSRVNTAIDERGIKKRTYFDFAGQVLRDEQLNVRGGIASSTDNFYDALGRVVANIDPEGAVTRTSYDGLGKPILTELESAQHVDATGNSYEKASYTRTEYDLAGRAIAQYFSSHRGEDVVSMDLNGLGMVLEQQIPFTGVDGTVQTASTSFEYDAAGNQITIIDSLGNRSEKTYTARGQLLELTDPEGNKNRYEYDLVDRKTLMTDPRELSGAYGDVNFSLEYLYDDQDRLTGALLPGIRGEGTPSEIKFTYDDIGNVTSRTNPDEGTTTYEYNKRRFKTAETISGQTGSGSTVSYRTEYRYDGVGNVIETIGPDGMRVQFVNDALGNVLETHYPNGAVVKNTYNGRSQVRTSRSGNNFLTSFAYDELGRLAAQYDAEQGVTRLGYDERGNLVLTVDPAGDRFLAVFDERGQVIKEVNSRGKIWSYEYDLAGNLLSSEDPRGTEITYGYDRRNLPVNVNYSNTAEGAAINRSFTYDEAGTLITAAEGTTSVSYNMENGSYKPDPYGNIWSAGYSGFGTSHEVRYSYDRMQRRTGITYTDDDTVNYTYNTLGQLETIPGYIDTPISYNDAGFVSSYTYANGQVSSFTFDENNRLKSMVYTDNQGAELDSYVLGYDNDNNIISRNQDYYSYDKLGRLQSAMIVGDAGVEEYNPGTALYRFGTASEDVLGQLPVSLTGDVLTVRRDAGSITIDAGYGYNMKRIVFSDVTVSSSLVNENTLKVFTSMYNSEDSYAKTDEVSIIVDSTANTITIEFAEPVFTRFIKLHSTVHNLDVNGEVVAGSSLFSANSSSIELIALTGGRNEFYNYTPDGNRTQVSILAATMVTTPYSYYANSDLIKKVGDTVYRYDANGNLVEKGNVFTGTGDDITITPEGDYRKYEFDILNRLVKVYTYSSDTAAMELSVEYGYDVNNLRVYRKTGDGEVFHYVFDTSGNRIEEHTADGTDYFFWRKGKHIAKRSKDGNTYFYSTDNVGSTVLMTDDVGTVVWSGQVTPFGDKISEEGSLAGSEELKYQGKDYDNLTGLVYMNARWYDPEIGRFISEDPARDGGNWYAFVSNNPLIYTDPTGLQPRLTPQQRRQQRIDRRDQQMYAAMDEHYGQIAQQQFNENFRQNALDNAARYTSNSDDYIYPENPGFGKRSDLKWGPNGDSAWYSCVENLYANAKDNGVNIDAIFPEETKSDNPTDVARKLAATTIHNKLGELAADKEQQAELGVSVKVLSFEEAMEAIENLQEGQIVAATRPGHVQTVVVPKDGESPTEEEGAPVIQGGIPPGLTYGAENDQKSSVDANANNPNYWRDTEGEEVDATYFLIENIED